MAIMTRGAASTKSILLAYGKCIRNDLDRMLINIGNRIIISQGNFMSYLTVAQVMWSRVTRSKVLTPRSRSKVMTSRWTFEGRFKGQGQQVSLL